MPTNPTLKGTDLVVEGSHYRLIFDFEAIALAEEMTGKSILLGLTQRDVASPTINLVRRMLLACLIRYNPDFTLETVKPLVTRENIGKVWASVLNAWAESIPEPEQVPEALADPIPSQS